MKIKCYLCQKVSKSTENKVIQLKFNVLFFFKFPSIGRYSGVTKQKLCNTVKHLCKTNVNIQLISKPFIIPFFTSNNSYHIHSYLLLYTILLM